MVPEIFPKPVSAYQSPRYSGLRHLPIDPGYDRSLITVVGGSPRLRAAFLSQNDSQRFSHVGRLAGEYALLRWGLLAIDRDGVPLRINSAPDEDFHHNSWFHQLENYCASEEYLRERDEALETWDSLQRIEAPLVLTEVHATRNYYHFSTGLLPKIRYTTNAGETTVCLPRDLVCRPFQIDLLRKTCGHRMLNIYDQVVRVRDPFLVQETLTREGARWLRKVSGLEAKTGRRRIYITRRTTNTGREHGRVLETEAFMRLLREFDFETIDFGEGDVPISDQVRKLDGAGVILSPHGANLTNTLYLHGKAAIIELLPRHWLHPGYMQIAALSDLIYRGIICEIDDQFRIQVDLDLVRAGLNETLRLL